MNESLLEFEPLFYESGMTLDSAVEGNVYAEGDAKKLTQIMSILLDNALKDDDPAFPVRVVLKSQTGQSLLCVAGHGTAVACGLPEYLQAVLPGRSGAERCAELRSGAVHRGKHPPGARREHLGGAQKRRELLLCQPAASNPKTKTKKISFFTINSLKNELTILPDMW